MVRIGLPSSRSDRRDSILPNCGGTPPRSLLLRSSIDNGMQAMLAGTDLSLLLRKSRVRSDARLPILSGTKLIELNPAGVIEQLNISISRAVVGGP